MLGVALCLAHRATCAKLAVGCVLTDTNGRIIGSGYNGNARGLPHCIEHPCKGATSLKGADLCEAIHAEMNALLVCKDPDKVYTSYTTHAPCMRCTKMLLNTGCKRIIYHNESYEPAAYALWTSTGREWKRIDN